MAKAPLRVNFLKPERDKIAMRAAFRCSFPGCPTLTVGPGVADDKVEVTGKAAHIHAAAAGGPRGQGALTVDQLRAVANGIWMCGQHADLIDKNNGERYPVSTLQSWKALHEFQVAYEHSGRQATFGFVRKIAISASPLFEPDTVLELAKATILVGANGTGKSALCEWISAIGTPQGLWRWTRSRKPLHYEILFSAPAAHTLKVSAVGSAPELKLDGVPVPSNPIPVSVTYLEERGERNAADDFESFRKVLKLDPMTLRSLATFIDGTSVYLSGAEWVDEKNDDGDKVTQLNCHFAGSAQRFATLSGSAKGRVVLDFAIAYVRAVSVFVPAVLIIEVKQLGLSWESFAPYMALFTRSDTTFQTLITTWELPAAVEQLGWQVYRIEGVEGPTPRRVVASAALV